MAPRSHGATTPPLRILLVEDDDGDAVLVEEQFAVTGTDVAEYKSAIVSGSFAADCSTALYGPWTVVTSPYVPTLGAHVVTPCLLQ